MVIENVFLKFSQVLGQSDTINQIIKKSFYIIDPTNISEHFSLYVTTIQTSLIKNNRTNFPKIIIALLNECFSPGNHQRSFINQLEILLNQHHVQNLLGEKDAELDKLRKTVLQRLCGQGAIVKTMKSVLKITHFGLENEHQAIRLLDVIGVLLFNAKSELNALVSELCSFNTDSVERLRMGVYGSISVLKSINTVPYDSCENVDWTT